MKLKASYTKHILKFLFDARTSRGTMNNKKTYFIKIYEKGEQENYGLGECSTIKGLSPDHSADYEHKIQYFCNKFESLDRPEAILDSEELKAFPSIYFGFETAVKDLENGGERLIFPNAFSLSEQPIPINGLVWMGDKAFMAEQLEEKLAQNFKCIKIKIGGIAFEEELSLLQSIRERFSPEQITIRLDANGAFTPENALEKLKALSEFDIHSIEQPIKQGQYEEMAKLCQTSPIPIALDEELIGIREYSQKSALLNTIKPAYIILKLSLVGGFRAAEEWIRLCEFRQTDWWITSALESNIGLNAIAQFTGNFNNPLPQGLGTGKLYSNNIPSPLAIEDGHLKYIKDKSWDLAYV